MSDLKVVRPYVMVGAMESLKTDFIHAHIERR